MAIAGAVLAWLAQTYPQIPQESILAILTWIGGSMIGQIIGNGDTKPAWKTTEFWGVFFVSALKGVFPDIPDSAFYGLLAFIGLRPVVKGSAGFSLSKLGGGK